MLEFLLRLIRDDTRHISAQGGRQEGAECAGIVVSNGIGGGNIISSVTSFFQQMHSERLKLTGFERVKYFAPVAICGYLSALDRKSTRLNSSHLARSRMPSSA